MKRHFALEKEDQPEWSGISDAVPIYLAKALLQLGIAQILVIFCPSEFHSNHRQFKITGVASSGYFPASVNKTVCSTGPYQHRWHTWNGGWVWKRTQIYKAAIESSVCGTLHLPTCACVCGPTNYLGEADQNFAEVTLISTLVIKAARCAVGLEYKMRFNGTVSIRIKASKNKAKIWQNKYPPSLGSDN